MFIFVRVVPAFDLDFEMPCICIIVADESIQYLNAVCIIETGYFNTIYGLTYKQIAQNQP